MTHLTHRDMHIDMTTSTRKRGGLVYATRVGLSRETCSFKEMMRVSGQWAKRVEYASSELSRVLDLW